MKNKVCGFCASKESDYNSLIVGKNTYICSKCVVSLYQILFDGIDPSGAESDRILIDATEVIKNAEAILVCTGAGMSVDSYLPTYRDKEGFWNDYPLYRNIKKDYVAMATPQGFTSDAHFTWGFFAHQYRLYKDAIPHGGYCRLLDMLNNAKKDYFVVTTNVDGLFLKAGFPSDHLHEAHGSVHKLQCSRTCKRVAWKIDNLDVKINYSTMNALDPLPLCPSCGAVSRPNICMFGDTDDSYIWEESQDSARSFREWRQKNKHKEVVILEIGVGAEGLKSHVKSYCKEFSNVTLIRINPEYDSSYDMDIAQIQCGAKDALLTLANIYHIV